MKGIRNTNERGATFVPPNIFESNGKLVMGRNITIITHNILFTDKKSFFIIY
jgi:hypothetical protein